MAKLAIHDQPGQLLTVTSELLELDPRSALDLHKEIGLPLYWLQAFARGGIANPSVNRIEFLYKALTDQPLTISK